MHENLAVLDWASYVTCVASWLYTAVYDGQTWTIFMNSIGTGNQLKKIGLQKSIKKFLRFDEVVYVVTGCSEEIFIKSLL